VQLTPASDEATTVEQHLRAECSLCQQRLRVGLPFCPLHGALSEQLFLQVYGHRHLICMQKKVDYAAATHVQARAEQHANQLLDQWRSVKEKLIAAA
jgi:hypothetical protein